MSQRAALVLAITVLILLGVLALWLINVPLWAAAVVGLACGSLAVWIARWVSNRRNRQKTET